MVVRKLRLGLIFGGRSPEHDVSIASARFVADAADASRYEVVPLGIDRQGHWLSRQASRLMLEGRLDPLSAQHTSPWKALRGIQVAFPIVHGPQGEDGTLQGLLELADIPYVGCGVLASALGMDKALMKAAFRDRGLPTASFMVVEREQWESQRWQVLAEVEAQFHLPCFVKPANGGSSIGTSKVNFGEELAWALDEAARFDRKLLVEEAIDGREVECAVLGNGQPQASGVGEVVPAREFYDYEAKYHDQRTRLIVPASLPSPVAEEVRRLSVAAFRAIDGAGMARVDFLVVAPGDKVYINEINTIPGFTSVSMYPKLWQASGLDYPGLIDALIALALERHRDKKRNAAFLGP